MIDYCFRNILTSDRMLDQFNRYHILTNYSFRLNFNIIIPSGHVSQVSPSGCPNTILCLLFISPIRAACLKSQRLALKSRWLKRHMASRMATSLQKWNNKLVTARTAHATRSSQDTYFNLFRRMSFPRQGRRSEEHSEWWTYRLMSGSSNFSNLVSDIKRGT
jgi:hypothetical protein